MGRKEIPVNMKKPWKDKEKLEKLYKEEKKSTVEIGEELGCHESNIYYWMDKFNIEMRSQSESVSLAKSKSFSVKFTYDYGGYKWLRIWIEGERNHIKEHRLCAVAWFGLEETKSKVVHHKNGIKWDNREENLELMEEGEHISQHTKGENHRDAKLTEEDVIEIRDRWEEENITHPELAEEFDVNRSTIASVVSGENWQI